MKAMESTTLKIGFLPLTDAAPLIVARERGFFAEQGLSVELSKEPSWANIRDKVAVGLLDAAQMLVPMVLSGTLGLGNVRVGLTTALCLNRGGNAITLGQPLLARLHPDEAPAAGLARLVAEGRQVGAEPLVFAVVYPFSQHYYELCLWLEAAGLDPARDIRLTVVPPPMMVASLASGAIAGYCVGEPWNSRAERLGLGRVVATARQIHDGRMEKVLGVRTDWARVNPDTHRAMVRALLAACRWADRPENRAETAEIIAQGQYLGLPAALVRQTLDPAAGLVFHADHANFPSPAQGLWLLDQMHRHGQLSGAIDWRATVAQVFDTALYSAIANELGVDVPAGDGFVDPRRGFDAAAVPAGIID